MSTDVSSYGYMAELSVPLIEDEIDTFNEKHDGFKVNYEGTLIRRIIKEKVDSPYVNAVFDIDGGFPLHVVGKVKPFVDVWYDGCDDPMDELTVEEFRKI